MSTRPLTLIAPRFTNSAKLLFAAQTAKHQPQAQISEGDTFTSRQKSLRYAAKNALLIPVLPLAGYWGLDATGVTETIASHSPMMERILGEGFGHAGLCFSLHFVLQAVQGVYYALKPSKNLKGKQL
ncbi:MAG: hypothetical protein K2X01_05075 [Cyanobacteria bacterium]|nr:hypothetical protein [Cyanobacteriota bacterium]